MAALREFYLPDELITKIFKYCSLETLYHAMQVNRRFYRCSMSLSLWKVRMHEISGWSLDKNETYCETVEKYKEICRRFTSIFGSNSKSWSRRACCVKCSQICCDVSCIREYDEMIIFDFGSKTTWFKFASNTTGQLSMHPTIGPIASANQLSPSSFAVTDSEFCPICTRIILRCLPPATSSALEFSSETCDIAAGATQNSRFSRAFSKLSLKNLNCLNVPEAERCLTEEDLIPWILTSVDATHGSVPLLEENLRRNLDARSTLNRQSTNSSITPTEDGCSTTTTQQKIGCSQQSQILVQDVAPSAALPDERGKDRLGIYKFLIRHMLKRNPFFHIQNISFAVCEPVGWDEPMKRALTKLLLCDFKVPGVCFVPKSIGVALYTGLDTCLVVDSGANNTVISPVLNLDVCTNNVQHVNIGGSHLTRRLLDCIHSKGLGLEVSESSIDSSQVKRECYLAYNTQIEARRKIAMKDIVIKGSRDKRHQFCNVKLSHELYQLSEDMYLHLNLPQRILDSIAGLDFTFKKQLVSNIILTGGNCRLTGLPLRLAHDLQKLLPNELIGSVHVVDPRLMTGRSDAVIGAAYVKRWSNVKWITRKDYILGDESSTLSSLSVVAGSDDDQMSQTLSNSRSSSTSSDPGGQETCNVGGTTCTQIVQDMVSDSIEFVEIV